MFFQVFFGVCFFGLYHGLVYLPVVLSLIGPAPYKVAFKSSVIELQAVTGPGTEEENTQLMPLGAAESAAGKGEAVVFRQNKDGSLVNLCLEKEALGHSEGRGTDFTRAINQKKEVIGQVTEV